MTSRRLLRSIGRHPTQQCLANLILHLADLIWAICSPKRDVLNQATSVVLSPLTQSYVIRPHHDYISTLSTKAHWTSTRREACAKCQESGSEQTRCVHGPVEQKPSVDADIKHTLVMEAGRWSPRPAASSYSDCMIMKQPCDDFWLSIRLLSENWVFWAVAIDRSPVSGPAGLRTKPNTLTNLPCENRSVNLLGTSRGLLRDTFLLAAYHLFRRKNYSGFLSYFHWRFSYLFISLSLSLPPNRFVLTYLEFVCPDGLLLIPCHHCLLSPVASQGRSLHFPESFFPLAAMQILPLRSTSRRCGR